MAGLEVRFALEALERGCEEERIRNGVSNDDLRVEGHIVLLSAHSMLIASTQKPACHHPFDPPSKMSGPECGQSMRTSNGRLTERQRTRSESASRLHLPHSDSEMSSAAPSGSTICVVAFPETPLPGAVRRTSQVPLGRFRVVPYTPDWSAKPCLVSNLQRNDTQRIDSADFAAQHDCASAKMASGRLRCCARLVED